MKGDAECPLCRRRNARGAGTFISRIKITTALRQLGIEVRAGLHTGECELVGDKVGGIAVHLGARIAAETRAAEVLVSSTVKDLVAGSGIRFEDRSTHTLRGIPEGWRLFAVASEKPE